MSVEDTKPPDRQTAKPARQPTSHLVKHPVSESASHEVNATLRASQQTQQSLKFNIIQVLTSIEEEKTHWHLKVGKPSDENSYTVAVSQILTVCGLLREHVI